MVLLARARSELVCAVVCGVASCTVALPSHGACLVVSGKGLLKPLSAGGTQCGKPGSLYWSGLSTVFKNQSLKFQFSKLRHSRRVREGHVYVMISEERRKIFMWSSCAAF